MYLKRIVMMTPVEKFNKVSYLQELCNKYGNFKVAIAKERSKGEFIWSKHRYVLDCWGSDGGLNFLSQVNNRSCLSCEIILDVDDDVSMENIAFILRSLKEYGFKYRAYSSGGRGWHIHVLIPNLALYSREYRERFRVFLISKFSTDPLKKTESAMIALEYVPHWRTGNTKKLIGWYK